MKIALLFVFSLLVLSSSVSAYTQINIYVDNAGNALFLGDSDESPNLPDGVTLQDGKISGLTSALTQKNGEVWTFSYKLNGSELNVVFPTGTVVKTLESGEIYLIGKQIGVYSNDYVQLEYTITQANNTNARTIVIVCVVIALLIGAYYYWKNNKKSRPKVAKKTKKKLHSVLDNVLNEREKLILAKVRDSGKIKSSYLRRALDVPKASFSRHIHELEKKKLIKLSGEGKNKFVEGI